MTRIFTIFLCVFLLPPLAGAVDISGKYTNKEGTIVIQKEVTSNFYQVYITAAPCAITSKMSFAKSGKTFKLEGTEEARIELIFTKQGLTLQLPSEGLPEECKNFKPQKPFKREG